MNKKIKVLILGITSNIGYRFFKLNKDFKVYGICRNWKLQKKNNIFVIDNIDIEKIETIVNKIQPDIMINCISIGNIDRCESNSDFHEKINVKLALDILDLSNKYNLKLISFSSSQVYDGKTGNYNENSKFQPLNHYGEQKVLYDNRVRQCIDNHILIRPSTIIGNKEKFQRANPTTFIIDKFLKNEDLLLVDDVITNFLFLDDLIEILYRLIIEEIVGEFNIGGKESMNRYQFGKQILLCFPNSSSKITPCDSSKFPTIAKRPLNTILDNKKIKYAVAYEFSSMDKIINRIVNEYC